jgi:hypothetical protein
MLRDLLDSWFRVLIKAVELSGYKWHEMTFCTRWTSSQSTILCIGTDSEFERLLQDSLGRMWGDLPPSSPWSMQVVLLEAIVALHDQAVWSVRDVTRNVEKVCRAKKLCERRP